MATVGMVIDNFMRCNICTDVCRQPSTLSCQHTFCQGCLIGYIRTQTNAVKTRCIPCPTCRRQTQVPNTNRPVEGITNTAHCSSRPTEGKTTPATHWCCESEASFCDGCLNLDRNMPTSHCHEATNSTDRSQVKRRKYDCEEHSTNNNLTGRNCRKPLCPVSCSVDHRSCNNVVTLQTTLPEVKQYPQNQQRKLTTNSSGKSKKATKNKNQIMAIIAGTSKIKSEIKEVIKNMVDLLHQKEDALMKKLDDITEQQTDHLQARVDSDEMETETDQQKAQFIQQTEPIVDELFDMYVTGSGAVADVTETQIDAGKEGKDISFIHNLEKLKEEIDKLDVRIVDDAIDLTASPVLQEVIDTNVDQTDQCNVTDVVRMKMEDIKVTVVADMNKTVMSIYSKNGERLSSQLKLKNCPWSLSVLSENKVVVSVPRSNQILTVGVNPDLELLSSLTTKKQYSGLAVLDQSTLVASCLSPPSIDLLDMMGHVIRSISARPLQQPLLENPQCLHVTSQGNILVSDYTAYSVVCLTQTGEVVFTYSPTGNSPRGIATTPAGDILVADSGTSRVLHLNKSGKFIRDILTSQNGVQYPRGLFIEGDRLCVATRHRGVQVFRFSR